MARKERERYTERNLPGRRADGISMADDGGGLKNPLILVGLGALAVAVTMALILLSTRGSNLTAQSGTATADAASGGTATALASAMPTTAAVAEGTEAAPPAAEPGAYTEPEDQAIDAAGKAYFATIKTGKGDIRMQLFPDVAPKHVNNFVFLAREGFYDGLKFHRVEPGFVIQGGDPQGTGMGGPGYSVPGEFNADNPVPHRAGSLAMARSSDPDSAGSQFYIVTEDGEGPTSLDGSYTVFGHVLSGMDVVRQIAVGDVMDSVTIEEKPIAESEITADDIRSDKRPEGGR